MIAVKKIKEFGRQIGEQFHAEHSRRGSEESFSNVLNPDASLCVGCAMHTFIEIGGQCPPYQE